MSKKYANECKRVSAKHMLALDAGNNVYTCSISVESLIMILDFYLTLIKLSLFILNIQGYFLLILPSNFIFLLIIFVLMHQFSSVQSLSRVPRLWDPMNLSTPGLPVYHQLSELAQTHVRRVSDAIQPSHALLSPSPPAPNPSQHQGLFQWVNSSHEVAKVLEFQLQHQSFQWTPRTDLL